MLPFHQGRMNDFCSSLAEFEHPAESSQNIPHTVSERHSKHDPAIQDKLTQDKDSHETLSMVESHGSSSSKSYYNSFNENKPPPKEKPKPKEEEKPPEKPKPKEEEKKPPKPKPNKRSVMMVEEK
ncbi:unnamed protein product [Didymodactylos carnosus]|uniref:Uncharacterized protein n=1 Tax=Didymodactylos carnosus TaxID=1234261 RepID=A0A8S2EKC4_9BILA|nr:unnamed protein product [Didymodactylos carnosus]CAF3982375.1 unnamed protein product [Didymodactylos carnosus]